jgi:hypothetical protein
MAKMIPSFDGILMPYSDRKLGHALPLSAVLTNIARAIQEGNAF